MTSIRPLDNTNLANAHIQGKKVLESSIHRIIPYLNSANDDDQKVVNLKSPQELEELFDFALKEDGCTAEHLASEIDKILEYGVMTQHKHFHNQLYAQSLPEAVAGEILTGITNANMFTFEVAPVYIMMENFLLEKMREKIGWSEGDGIFCPGGSISNFYAMNLARNYKFPEIKTEGLWACPKLALFTNAAGHYSITKAAAFLGIGTNAVYPVAFDQNYQMCEVDLRAKIQQAKEDGRVPFFVNATCGMTVFGQFDSIQMIAKVCREESMWLHCDASLGGPVLFSKKHKG